MSKSKFYKGCFNKFTYATLILIGLIYLFNYATELTDEIPLPGIYNYRNLSLHEHMELDGSECPYYSINLDFVPPNILLIGWNKNYIVVKNEVLQFDREVKYNSYKKTNVLNWYLIDLEKQEKFLYKKENDYLNKLKKLGILGKIKLYEIDKAREFREKELGFKFSRSILRKYNAERMNKISKILQQETVIIKKYLNNNNIEHYKKMTKKQKLELDKKIRNNLKNIDEK